MTEKDNLKVIYEILKKVESVQDQENADSNLFNAENFGISEPRYNKLMLAISNAHLVNGISQIKAIGMSNPKIKVRNPSLTLKGMEYLSYYSSPETFISRIKDVTEIVK